MIPEGVWSRGPETTHISPIIATNGNISFQNKVLWPLPPLRFENDMAGGGLVYVWAYELILCKQGSQMVSLIR